VAVVSVFQKYESKIRSPENELDSDNVLAILRKDLVMLV